MATAARQPKATARRANAWTTNARSSPTFTPPTSQSPRPGNQSGNPNFPPLGGAQANGTRVDNPQDKVLQSLSGLTGTTITLLTKTDQRLEGIVHSTNAEGNTTGVTLKNVKDMSNPSAPPKEQLFIAATNIESWNSGPADAKLTNGDSFRTDTDISNKPGTRGEGRELQAWQPPAEETNTGSSTFSDSASRHVDDETFGAGSSSNDKSWDQFAVNESLYGITTTFDENLYTTKLDRSSADYKERERKAQKIANEIMGQTANNPHIAEERNVVDDSGTNEEDKYGAVVRGQNAYIPPGARRTAQQGAAAPAANAAKAKDGEVPKVSVNAPDGASISQSSSPAPTNKPPADPLPAFRDFVTNEKQRLTQKRQALVKNEMDKRMADLVKFSQSFKLNKPIPDDLVPILAKDEEKQKAIREKSNQDATSTQARNIGPSTSSPNNIIPRAPPASKLASGKPVPPTSASRAAPNASASPPIGGTGQKPGAGASTSGQPPATKKAPNMFIQPIPPFKGSKTRPTLPASASAGNGSATPAVEKPLPTSQSAINNRLNVNASSFRPNPKGVTSPSQSNNSIASSSASPKPKDATPSTPNPFFGPRPIKRNPVNIKDDFNPFKHNKVVDASNISAMWPFSGKRYMLMFPPSQHPPQQQSPLMAPPVPPPMPPPSYEEDQAAARGFVYYPPYPYGQPMMSMPPSGPPGTFMPGPYMQHMPYPPGMPPNAMYPHGMQMPPQAYMPPPPPGAYAAAPPPNGAAGPRPSMPPTPIPSHAHPYYAQSPQLQHAVPYPMMMPPNGVQPPHGYEGAPGAGQQGPPPGPPPQQVQMGGGGHA